MRFSPAAGQQSFSDEHWNRLATAFDALEALGAWAILEPLYRASYSETFAADLRALLLQVAPELDD